MNRIHKLLAIFCLFVFAPVISLSDDEVKTNFALIDSLFVNAADSVLQRLDHFYSKEMTIRFSKHPAKWMLEQYLLNKAQAKGRKFYSSSDKEISILSINIKEVGVRYEKTKKNDTLQREVFLNISLSLESGDNLLHGLPQISLSRIDEISRKNISYIQSSPYDFVKGEVPEEESTLFEKITEPVIFISTAIITIALLFSVRSG